MKMYTFRVRVAEVTRHRNEFLFELLIDDGLSPARLSNNLIIPWKY